VPIEGLAICDCRLVGLLIAESIDDCLIVDSARQSSIVTHQSNRQSSIVNQAIDNQQSTILQSPIGSRQSAIDALAPQRVANLA
jgi:hypothetical protein